MIPGNRGKVRRYPPVFQKFHRVCRLFTVLLRDDAESKDALSTQHRWQMLNDNRDGSVLVQNAVTFVLFMKSRIAGQPGMEPKFSERIFLNPQQFLEFIELARREDVYEYAKWLVSQPSEFNVSVEEYLKRNDEDVLVPQDFDL